MFIAKWHSLQSSKVWRIYFCCSLTATQSVTRHSERDIIMCSYIGDTACRFERCVLPDFKLPVRLYAVIKIGFARFQTFSMSLCSHEGVFCQISNFQQVFMQPWRCGLPDFKLPASLYAAMKVCSARFQTFSMCLCSHEGVFCQILNCLYIFMQS